MKRGRTNKIGWQLILLIVFTIVLPSVFFLGFLVNRYAKDLYNQSILERQNILQEINRCVEMQFVDYQELSMTIYYSEPIRNFIDSRAYENPTEEELASLKSAMETIINTKNNITALWLCFDDFVLQYGRNFFGMDAYRAKYEERIQAQGGRCVWLPTEQMQAAQPNQAKVFALARAVNGPEEPAGVFYMFCTINFFSSVMTSDVLTSENSHYYVVSPENQIVISDDLSIVGTVADLNFDIQECVDAVGAFVVQAEQENLVVSYAKMETVGWTSVIVSDVEAISGNARHLQRIALAFSFLYLIGLGLGYVLITKLLIGPVQTLSTHMQFVANGQFQEFPLVPGNNEISNLSKRFNEMVRQIQHLMDQVRLKEAEKNRQRVKVLYMQIGPHFLYNTLNSVKWLAELNNQQNIKQMVEALMKLMAGVVYNSTDDITLQEELELLEGYFHIQKIRFTNFRVVYEVPQDILHLKIGKFMLQPFVENSILHGLRNVPYEGVITIRGWREEVLFIEIHDNGCGFDADDLNQQEKSKDEKDHIGIKNVKERIEIYYGKQYDVQLKSKPGSGTTVLMRLPINEERRK